MSSPRNTGMRVHFRKGWLPRIGDEKTGKWGYIAR
jgi:hypothetical protein